MGLFLFRFSISFQGSNIYIFSIRPSLNAWMNTKMLE